MKAAAVAAEARTHVAVNFMVTVVVVGFGKCRPAAVEAAAGRRVKHTVKKIPADPFDLDFNEDRVTRTLSRLCDVNGTNSEQLSKQPLSDSTVCCLPLRIFLILATHTPPCCFRAALEEEGLRISTRTCRRPAASAFKDRHEIPCTKSCSMTTIRP